MSWTSLIIILLVSFVFLIVSASDDDSSGFSGFCGGIFLSVIVAICIKANSPQAIDVYQGKTELEYTIRGGEVVDSVVVYKKD